MRSGAQPISRAIGAPLPLGRFGRTKQGARVKHSSNNLTAAS
jgi:hypothetical protein